MSLLAQLIVYVLENLLKDLGQVVYDHWTECRKEKERADAQSNAIQNMAGAKTEEAEKEAFKDYVSKT